MRFPEPFPYSRRFFLQRGLTLASLAATVPSFIERSALALALPAGVSPGAASGVLEDRILVVIQLSGGNDGLNTVVPYGIDEYYEARPQLAVSRPGTTGGALTLSGSSEVGLHPGLAPLKELFDHILSPSISTGRTGRCGCNARTDSWTRWSRSRGRVRSPRSSASTAFR